ncbi:hypothetical protein BC629DRAFT_1442884 [Irpex lacteus]|nr:hypothetical protein BC629DRAFT_1442884 [Irpex lacteus]
MALTCGHPLSGARKIWVFDSHHWSAIATRDRTYIHEKRVQYILHSCLLTDEFMYPSPASTRIRQMMTSKPLIPNECSCPANSQRTITRSRRPILFNVYAHERARNTTKFILNLPPPPSSSPSFQLEIQSDGSEGQLIELPPLSFVHDERW